MLMDDRLVALNAVIGHCRELAELYRGDRTGVDADAQSLFERLEEQDSAGCENEDLRLSYRLALLEMKLHHELVRIVVDTLGHVPEVPLDSGLH